MNAPLVDFLTSQEIMTACNLITSDFNYSIRKHELLSAVKRVTGQHTRKSLRRDGKIIKGYRMPPRIGAAGKRAFTVVAMPFEAGEFDWL